MLGASQSTTETPIRKALFTVTIFSKALAMMLFILLPMGAFYLGLTIGQAPLGPLQPQNEGAQKTHTYQTPKNSQLQETTYISNDYQFLTNFRFTDTCLTTNSPRIFCLPIHFADPAVATATTPILSLEDLDIQLAVFANKQKVSEMKKLGTTQLGGKTATAYYHFTGPIYEPQNFAGEFWLLEIPTTANRWLYVYIPDTDETLPQPNDPQKTLSDFEAMLQDRVQIQGSRLLQTLRFLDEKSVTENIKNWTTHRFAHYEFAAPADAVIKTTEFTLQISFPQTGSDPNEMQLNMFDFTEITKASSSDHIAGLEKMYKLVGTKPVITMLTPTLKLYTYVKTEPAGALFSSGTTQTTTQYFLIDEQNEKIIEVKSRVAASYWPTFRAITQSFR